MNIKKITACLLVMLTAVSCSSGNVGKTKEKSESGVKKISVTDSGNIYKKSALPMPSGFDRVTDFLFDETSGNIFIIGRDSGGALKCVVTDSNFGLYRPIELEIETGSQESLFDTVLFDTYGGKIFAVTCSRSESDCSCRLDIFGMDGKIISGGEIDTEGTEINSLVCGENGIFVGTGEVCMAVDDEGNVLRTSKEGIYSVLEFSDGRIIGEVTGKGNLVLRELDPETLEYAGFEAELSENTGGAFRRGTGEYLGFFADDGAVFGLKSDTVLERKVDLVTSGLSGLKEICPIADGDFIAMDGSELVRLSVRDSAEYGEIKEITLAITLKSNTLPSMISEFNANSTRYRVKLIDYSEGMEYSLQSEEMAADELEMDIISGKAPDMVFLEPNETNLLAGKGAFADLYEFMDKDSFFARDAFLKNYLEACEINGHLYSLEPTFMIQTIGAKKKFVSEPEWTLDDFKKAYNAMPEDMELFENGNNNAAVLNYLTNGGSAFVNNENFTCNFDSDEFIELLEFADQFPGVDEYDFEKRSCRNDTALLSVMYFSSFRDINAQVQGIFGDEEMTFAGFPTNSGKGSKILLGRRFSVMENSPNKEGAWEFIRSFLNDSCYVSDDGGTHDGIPVTESALKLVAERAMEKPYYIDESGNKVYMNETITDWNTMTEISIRPMNEEQKERYLDFVTSITAVSSGNNIDSSISDVINDETNRFFAGECTSSQAADMIQNRISIILSEQS